MRKLSCVVAVIGPMLLITILSAVTWQINAQRDLSFDAIPSAIWMLGMGLLVGPWWYCLSAPPLRWLFVP